MRHPNKSSSFLNRAESLIETVMAVTVIVLVSTTSLSMIRLASNSNEVIGEKVVALNLALEGVEALRNVRDSNYLHFASDADNCWNKFDILAVENCSDGSANEITDGSVYTLSQNLNENRGILFEWKLEEVNDEETEGFLDLYEFDESVPFYAQSDLPSASGFESVKEYAFQRLVSINYNDELDSYEASVTVKWTDRGGNSKSVTMTRLIAHIY
jgi:hypothetical protein